jgi:N-methylhydantoinase A/oxoprolinase/acetone carboxylase beta subunit
MTSSHNAALGLGIDAGGTYTDAVIYDLAGRRLVAKAKALTTYHDFVEGIRGALEQLPPDLLRSVAVTSLSTTLATNSVVEGRGHKVGLIVLSPWDWFAEEIGHDPWVRVPGSVDISGDVIEPLDEDACRSAAARLVGEERCAAVVVAGYGTIRNPEQANRVREIVRGATGVPVVCAHEVSRRMNGVRCAQTAVANARLLPVIQHLIESVHSALAAFGVPGRLMVVKGDGTPVDESVARARPVETILSGPAASVSGARILTGLQDALVMDIGGTTTDCAVLEQGHVAVSPDGARVGSWVMTVDVAEICTVGLGGDSRIDFTRDRQLTIGPQRNVPFAYLAQLSPRIGRFLSGFDDRQLRAAPDASVLDVLVKGGPSPLALTEREEALMALLADGPVPALEAARLLDIPSHRLLPTTRLEGAGMIKRGALTPTDLLHVTGQFVRWDAGASRRALELFATMYGRAPEDVLRRALDLVTRRIFEEALRREVSREDPRLHDLPQEWAFLLDKAFSPDGKGLEVRMALRRPIVAIGAPASVLMPPVREHLEAEVVVPEHADVANAIGAIGAEISVRQEVVIRPGSFSAYVLHATDERLEFDDLLSATERAEQIARSAALRGAAEAGAASPRVAVLQGDREGLSSDGGQVFLERRVTAVASGGAFGA